MGGKQFPKDEGGWLANEQESGAPRNIPQSALHKDQSFHHPVAEHRGVSQWKDASPSATATSTHSKHHYPGK